MFENLDEEIRRDEAKAAGPGEKALKWTIAGLVSAVVIAGLYLVTLM